MLSRAPTWSPAHPTKFLPLREYIRTKTATKAGCGRPPSWTAAVIMDVRTISADAAISAAAAVHDAFA
jgi:hypothetical protein